MNYDVLYNAKLQYKHRVIVKGDSYEYTGQSLFDAAQNDHIKIKARQRRVALLYFDKHQLIRMITACWYKNIEIVLINNRLTPHEIEQQLKSIQCNQLYTDQQSLKMTDEIEINRLNIIETYPIYIVDHYDDQGDYDDPKDSRINKRITTISEQNIKECDAISTIMFTSGTTGRAKAVPQRVKNHYFSAIQCQGVFDYTVGDYWINMMPLYHVSGLSILIRSLISGIQCIIIDKFSMSALHQVMLNLDNVNNGKNIMNENKLNQNHHRLFISCVPKMIQEIFLADFKLLKTFDGILVGGASLNRQLIEQCIHQNIPIYHSYGMTETCSQFITANIDALQINPNTVGDLDHDLKHRVLIQERDEEGIGALWIKGDNVIDRYLNISEKMNDEIFNEGWFNTGDLAKVIDDQYLIIADRRKDLIISGGENIYPKEIEAVLDRHPNVLESAVIGKANQEWGARPVAYIVLKDQTIDFSDIEHELKGLVVAKLSKYKHPDQYIMIDELPRNQTGKVTKYMLQEDGTS